MAHGSCRAFRGYVNKVWDIESRLNALKDSRTNPKVPQGAVLNTWYWSFVRRVKSTEQLGKLLADKRWRRRIGLRDEDGGSPDTAAQVLDQLVLDEINELALEQFFVARRAGVLKDGGPYGLRCAIVDMNELYCSEKIHCDQCLVRHKDIGQGVDRHTVKEYHHDAVALVWAGSDIAWPINWEMLRPGEGELTATLRLLTRLLPKLSKTLDLVMGDALYCCRPFFELVHQYGIGALAISSGTTEMDEEMDLLVRSEPPKVGTNHVATWVMESEAWEHNVGCKLRVMHYENRAASKSYLHKRKQLRVVTTVKVDILPSGQGWQVGCCRWVIENGTFNILTRDYHLEHNYHHTTTAIATLLVLRSLAYCMTQAYRRFAQARAKNASSSFFDWWEAVLVEDWFRYLDAALNEPAFVPSG
jgi:hypothetical protein